MYEPRGTGPKNDQKLGENYFQIVKKVMKSKIRFSVFSKPHPCLPWTVPQCNNHRKYNQCKIIRNPCSKGKSCQNIGYSLIPKNLGWKIQVGKFSKMGGGWGVGTCPRNFRNIREFSGTIREIPGNPIGFTEIY